VLAISLAVLSCNAPSGDQVQGLALTLTALINSATAAGMATLPPAVPVLPADTLAPPTATLAAATGCTPMVTANLNANVRRGPSTEYSEVGYLPSGGTAPLAGRNEDNSWWYIVFAGGPGGYAWIAQSVTTASCLPAVVQVVAAPPLPATDTPEPEAEEFAVIHVTYDVSGSCGDFDLVANVTTNGPGTVEYYWVFNGTDPHEGTFGSTLVFNHGGTKHTPVLHWSISASGDHFAQIYIESPNHQYIGQGNVHCP
jgi:hypothetical protein